MNFFERNMCKVFLSMLLMLSLLFCSSCNRSDVQPQFLHEIYSHVRDNQLPPLETAESEAMLAPGERAPVEWLYRAPQDLVGEKVNLSVEVSEWEDMSSKEFLYCFEKQDSGKGKLWVLYTPEVGDYNAVMLTLETPYATAEALLSEEAAWSGTVISIDLVTAYDYMYPRSRVSLAMEEQSQSTEGAICYGRIRFVQEDGSIERLSYSCDAMDEIGAFRDTFERFGVLE